jgi:hypothetical protein
MSLTGGPVTNVVVGHRMPVRQFASRPQLVTNAFSTGLRSGRRCPRRAGVVRIGTAGGSGDRVDAVGKGDVGVDVGDGDRFRN